MDILTKICIVVLVVLNLLAVPVFLKSVLVPENYKLQYEQASAQAGANERDAADARLAYKRVLDEAQTLQKALQAAQGGYEAQILALRNHLETEQLRNADQEAKLASINVQMVALSSNYERYIDRATLFTDRMAEQQALIDRLTTENSDLYDQLKQKTADYERIELIGKSRLERISELQETIDQQAEQMERLRAGGPGVSVAARPGRPIETGAVVSGTITAVTADNLASINIGSANGVKRGMEMVIVRGGQFVGYLRIEEVDLNTAAGIIVEKVITPTQGDKVVTRPGLYR